MSVLSDDAPNWESGEVHLWLNNEEVYYRILLDFLKEESPAEMLRSFIYDMLDDFDGELFYMTREQFDKVDWDWIIEYNQEDEE